MRDTERQIEKTSLGQYMGDRGYVQEKTTHTNTNETNEHQNLIGLQTDEVQQFQREWKDLTADFWSWPVKRAASRPAALEAAKKESGSSM